MKTRKIYLDILRAIACCMVVGVHVSAQQITKLGTSSISFKFMNATDCLCIIGVPLFVMISGALMLNPEHNKSLKKLYGHHIIRLLIAYFAWLLFYNIEIYIQNGHWFSYETFKKEVIIETLMGKGMYHMWFMPMILGLYILTPLLQGIVYTRKNCEYFLILYFIFNLFYNTIFKFTVPYEVIVNSAFTLFPLGMLEGYVGYYILGFYLDHYISFPSKHTIYAISLLGLVNYVWEVTICNYVSAQKDELSTILNDPLTVNAFFISTALFMMARHLFGNINIAGNFYRLCKALGRYSFGVYLVHPFILSFMTQSGITTLLLPVPISIPLMVAVVVGISYALTWIISRIPLIGRYLV